MEQGVHHQVRAAGAPQAHATEGQHEAEPTTRGLHLLSDRRRPVTERTQCAAIFYLYGRKSDFSPALKYHFWPQFPFPLSWLVAFKFTKYSKYEI